MLVLLLLLVSFLPLEPFVCSVSMLVRMHLVVLDVSPYRLRVRFRVRPKPSASAFASGRPPRSLSCQAEALRVSVRVGHISPEHLGAVVFLKAKWVKCMKKSISFTGIQQKSVNCFKKHWFYMHKWVKCMKKYWFCRYPIRVSQFALKKSIGFKIKMG